MTYLEVIVIVISAHEGACRQIFNADLFREIVLHVFKQGMNSTLTGTWRSKKERDGKVQGRRF